MEIETRSFQIFCAVTVLCCNCGVSLSGCWPLSANMCGGVVQACPLRIRFGVRRPLEIETTIGVL
jgi:hypothetical protein